MKNTIQIVMKTLIKIQSQQGYNLFLSCMFCFTFIFFQTKFIVHIQAQNSINARILRYLRVLLEFHF